VTAELDSKEVLTITEAAKLLGVERHTVSRMIRRGTLPAVRLAPRIVRIPRTLLLRRLEEMAEGETA
jgi:excisionase family DNA binding protein